MWHPATAPSRRPTVLLWAIASLALVLVVVLAVWGVPRRPRRIAPLRDSLYLRVDEPVAAAVVKAATPAQSERRGRLVLVPCHGVFLGVGASADPRDSSAWRVDPWLVPHVSAFVEHVRKALELARARDDLIMFSGGVTKADAGDVSEAAGYGRLAELLVRTHPELGDGKPPTFWGLEERARDSMENLMYSMCEFKRVRGVYPARVLVVGFNFKRRRFVGQHARALRLEALLEFVGLDREMDADHEPMEVRDVIPLFERDPFGCEPPLSTKRAGRDPFHHPPGPHYAAVCPELADLFSYCGAAPFPGRLPWD